MGGSEAAVVTPISPVTLNYCAEHYSCCSKCVIWTPYVLVTMVEGEVVLDQRFAALMVMLHNDSSI